LLGVYVPHSKRGMPEAARVSQRPWPAGFGRAYPYRGTLPCGALWKPDLLINKGKFHPGTVLCGLGETGLA